LTFQVAIRTRANASLVAVAGLRTVLVAVQDARPLGASDCETIGAGVLGQPAATLSSLAYLVAGAWLARHWRTLPGLQRSTGMVYAGLLMLCGVGSVVYHGPGGVLAGPLHDVPIVLLLGAVVAVPAGRWLRERRVVRPGTTRDLALLAVLLLGSGAAYLAGRTGGPLCDPTSIVQGHALWHVGTAAALALWGALLWPVPAVDGRAREPGTTRLPDVQEQEAIQVVSALQAKGVRASLARPGLYRFGVRVLIGDGREALWDVDGAAGLEAQIMRNGVLVGFVPKIPGSSAFDVQQQADAIAATDYGSA
jgi:hypothetical protein